MYHDFHVFLAKKPMGKILTLWAHGMRQSFIFHFFCEERGFLWIYLQYKKLQLEKKLASLMNFLCREKPSDKFDAKAKRNKFMTGRFLNKIVQSSRELRT